MTHKTHHPTTIKIVGTPPNPMAHGKENLPAQPPDTPEHQAIQGSQKPKNLAAVTMAAQTRKNGKDPVPANEIESTSPTSENETLQAATSAPGATKTIKTSQPKMPTRKEKEQGHQGALSKTITSPPSERLPVVLDPMGQAVR